MKRLFLFYLLLVVGCTQAVTLDLGLLEVAKSKCDVNGGVEQIEARFWNDKSSLYRFEGYEVRCKNGGHFYVEARK